MNQHNKQEVWIVWNKKEDIPLKTIPRKIFNFRRELITFESEDCCLDWIEEFFELNGFGNLNKKNSVSLIYEPRLAVIEFKK